MTPAEFISAVEHLLLEEHGVALTDLALTPGDYDQAYRRGWTPDAFATHVATSRALKTPDDMDRHLATARAALRAAHLALGAPGTSLPEDVTDLLADLRHLCAAEDLCFDDCARLAAVHFELERNSESPQPPVQVPHAGIRIFIRDGIVFGAETFAGQHVCVDVVDYDTDGHDPEDLTLGPNADTYLQYTS